MSHILEDFASVTSQVPGRVVALGSVYRETKVAEKVKGGFLKGLLGAVGLKAVEPDRWLYLALTDQQTAHILDFADGALIEKEDLALAGVQATSVQSDESLLRLEFQHAGKNYKLKVQRYQLPDLENGLLHDPEQMKQVGEMTKTLEAAFRSRA